MSGGEHHPAALRPTIHYSLKRTTADDIPLTAITDSRLVVVVRAPGGDFLLILDWKSSQVLFVG